ncbi:MAG: hypothetical protein QOE70_6596 [Chthoniobacter sp.]|jgi:hypothetical protein|nr:hypothetical protein [Chthoniobacter sp.]
MRLHRRNFCRLALAALAAVCLRSLLGAERAPETPDFLRTPIERHLVESTSIASIGFDARFRILEIEFRSGAIYRYDAVPPEIWEGLQRAASKGRYFSQHIRGQFAFQRRLDPKP